MEREQVPQNPSQYLAQYFIPDLINIIADYFRGEVYNHSIKLHPKIFGSHLITVLCSKDLQERIYVTIDDYIMKIFSFSGELLDEWPKKMSYDDFKFSSDGKLYASGYGDELYALEPSGEYIYRGGNSGEKFRKLAIGNQDSEIYFLDRKGNVHIMSSDFRSRREFLGNKKDFKPSHIFFSATEDLYLASSTEVKIFTKKGRLIGEWIPKDEKGNPITISRISMSEFQEIYITDIPSYNIYVFRPKGQFIRIFEWRSKKNE